MLLIVGLMTRVAAVIAALLMFAFVFGIAWAWAHGLRIDCGCFGGGGQLGAGQEPTYLVDILRDFGLVLLRRLDRAFPAGTLRVGPAAGLGGCGAPASTKRRNGDEQGRPGEVGA